jgi:hypothetical protein
MSKHIVVPLLLLPLCSVVAHAGENCLYGFDTATCTRWEFTTDIVAYKDPGYEAASAMVQRMRWRESEQKESNWTIYEAINQKTYGKPLFGVCRHVFKTSGQNLKPSKFECREFGQFPLSGGTFSVVEDRGIPSRFHLCTTRHPKIGETLNSAPV